jgi:hypothetical protein
MRLAILALAAAGLGLAAPGVAEAAPRDQIVVEGSAIVPPGQTAGTVVVVDGPVTIGGHVTGDVVAVNGTVTIAGAVDGTVTTVAKQARLLPGARVGGDLRYADKKPFVAPGATVAGRIRHDNWENFGSAVSWAIRLIFWLAVSVSILVLGLALLKFSPRAAEAAWVVARQRTGLAIGWASGLFFGLPILVVVAMVTVFGLPLGLMLLLALVPLAALGYVASCWLLGRVILKQPQSPVRAFLAGWAVLRVAALIPFLGVLLFFVAGAFGLGVLLMAAWYGSDPRRVAPMPAPAPAGAQPPP